MTRPRRAPRLVELTPGTECVTAASIAPLPFRMRPDLIIRADHSGSRAVWVIKDPVRLRYFRFPTEEFELLRMLDGTHSLRDLRTHLEQLLAPVRVSLEHIESFLARLHADGLIVVDEPGQDRLLRERAARARRGRLRKQWSNPLAVRFPGVDPGSLLDGFQRLFGGLFHPVALLLAPLPILAALVWVLVHWDAFAQKLPTFEAFFLGRNLLVLLVTLAVVKVIHELGHAAACRRYGAECREIGLMLLVFMPTLYCNVSDAWMIPQRWKRVVVSLAGVYVELLLAAGATFLWWNSNPGQFQMICLNVMAVCSVSTIVINLNPLLRYDGYYALSDLSGTPNLWSRSREWWKSRGTRAMLGVDLSQPRLVSDRRAFFLAAYGLLSMLWRLVVIAAIGTMLLHLARKYRVESLARAMIALLLAGMFFPLLKGAVTAVREPGIRARIRPVRVVLTLGSAALLALLVFVTPFSFRERCPVFLEPVRPQYLYVSTPGRLDWSLPAESELASGTLIARLSNEQLDLEVERLRGERARQAARVEHLELQSIADPEAQNRLPAERETLHELERRWVERLRQQEQLQFVARRDGRLLSPPFRPPSSAGGDELPHWSRTPLDPENHGCFLDSGTLLGIVGDPGRLEAVILLREHQIDRLDPGQPVELLLTGSSGLLRGTIEKVSQLNLETVPRVLSSGEELPVQTTPDGGTRLLERVWQARVRFDAPPDPLAPGQTGLARVRTTPETLARRLTRWLRQTLRWD
jgi:putative peptide zinc metalloprotease protein